jgi:large subunit ribosomal protein L22
MKAILKNHRQSSRKVRIVADTIRGKSVKQSLIELSFLAKRSSEPIQKLVRSAAANAKNDFSLESDNLYIKEIRVDEGFTLKRWMPRARGRAFPIRKRTSHVFIELAEIDGSKRTKKTRPEVKPTKKPKKVSVEKKKPVEKVAKESKKTSSKVKDEKKTEKKSKPKDTETKQKDKKVKK